MPPAGRGKDFSTTRSASPGTGVAATCRSILSSTASGSLADLKDRGLPSPLLVISGGAPGLITAIEQACPHGRLTSLRHAHQRASSYTTLPDVTVRHEP